MFMFIASLSESHMCRKFITSQVLERTLRTSEPHEPFREGTAPSSTFLRPSSTLFSPDALAVS